MKSSFLTFVFSLIPGAGQMYLGMMKNLLRKVKHF